MLKNEFFLGYMSATIQTIFGHPLDTIKTIKQSGKNTIQIKYLYNGFKYPLLFNNVIIASQFYLNKYICDILNNNNINKKKFTRYNKYNNYISGFISGAITTPIVNLIELYKVRRQHNLNLLNINKTRGIVFTLIKESMGNSIVFGTYYSFCDKINPFFVGGIAGWLSWCIVYPIDVIKTRIQLNEKNIKFNNIWKGFGYCSIRTILCSSIGFRVYQIIKDSEYNIKH
jgi:hypothetical protein